MLYAAIVYVQGSAGNLLTRCLTLDTTTIPGVSEDQRYRQPTLAASTEQRLQWYDNWNTQSWRSAEESLKFWCHCDDQSGPDFYEYADSPLKFIDQYHPGAFESENTNEVLWTKNNAWQHMVFITFADSSLDSMIQFANAKRPCRENTDYIHNIELPSYTKLYQQYPNALTFPFECILEFNTFYPELTKLANHLNLHLPEDAVKLLWNQWHTAHNKVIKL